jgi:hypothetical protein
MRVRLCCSYSLLSHMTSGTAPYQLFWVEIGNEQDHTNQGFISQVTAFATQMNVTAQRLGLTQRLGILVGGTPGTGWAPSSVSAMVKGALDTMNSKFSAATCLFKLIQRYNRSHHTLTWRGTSISAATVPRRIRTQHLWYTLYQTILLFRSIEMWLAVYITSASCVCLAWKSNERCSFRGEWRSS